MTIGQLGYPLGLLADNHGFLLCLGFGFSSSRMFSSPLLLHPLRLQHRPLELIGFVNWLWQISSPVGGSSGHCQHQVTSTMTTGVPRPGKYRAHLAIFPTSASIFHRSLSVSRYSIAARSRAPITPNLSEAFAFQILTFPSSEPDNTNLASAVKTVENTLLGYDVGCRPIRSSDQSQETLTSPLHSFGMVHLRLFSDPFFPNPNGAVPSATHELGPCWAPIATDHGRNVCFVYLCGRGKFSYVKGVQIMIF